MLRPLLALASLASLASGGDIDPGDIGIRFYGNEYTRTEPFSNMPAEDFTVTLKVKGAQGNILSYGIPGAGFDGQHFALADMDNLIVTRGSGDPWTTNVGLGDGVWHAIAVTWDYATGLTKVYKDGVFVIEQEMSQMVGLSDGGVMVLGQLQGCEMGCFPEGTGYVGVIADMTLWSRALTAQQVEYLSQNAPSGDEQDLIGFWPLNEKDGAVVGADKVNVNVHYVGGPAVTTDVGMNVATHALSFSGQDLVVLTPNKDLPVNDLSIEFWMKSSTAKDCYMLSYYLADNTEPLILKNPNNLVLNHNGEQTETATNFADDVWNHVALTWTQSTGILRAYKNGGLVYPPSWLPEDDYFRLPSLDIDGTLPARPDRVVLGGRINKLDGSNFADGFGFKGQLQELRIWDTVRGQEEVEQLKDYQLPLDPLPTGLSLYWQMDEAENSLLAHDSASTNDGILSKPTWENTLIAPPFPTLDEVNGQVVELQGEMADLLEYVKVIMDPSLNVSATAASVTEPAACDRRYSYLCKTETKILGDAASKAGKTAGAAAKGTALIGAASSRSRSAQARVDGRHVAPGQASVLAQQALGAHHRSSSLSASLLPATHAHKAGSTVRLGGPAGPKAAKAGAHAGAGSLTSELLQTGETTSATVTMAEDPDEVARVSALPVEASYGGAANGAGRGRHAWAEGSISESAAASRTVPGTGFGHHRHSWSAGAQSAGPMPSLRRDLVHTKTAAAQEVGDTVEFVEEEEEERAADDGEAAAAAAAVDADRRRELVSGRPEVAQTESDDFDDEGPEALVRRKRPAVSKMQRNFISHQKPPAAKGAAAAAPAAAPAAAVAPLTVTPSHDTVSVVTKARAAGEEAWGQGDYDDLRASFGADAPVAESTLPDGLPPAPAADTTPPMVADDALLLQTDEGVRATPHRRHHTEHHHRHHKHHRHHDDQDDDSSAQSSPQSAQPAQPAQPAPAPVADLRHAVQPQPNSQQPQRGATVAMVDDNGGVGGAFEQVIMPGGENEWDEAIAEGVSNSDLSDDGVSQDDIAVAL